MRVRGCAVVIVALAGAARADMSVPVPTEREQLGSWFARCTERMAQARAGLVEWSPLFAHAQVGVAHTVLPPYHRVRLRLVDRRLGTFEVYVAPDARLPGALAGPWHGYRSEDNGDRFLWRYRLGREGYIEVDRASAEVGRQFDQRVQPAVDDCLAMMPGG
jgi:hypothetical protein